MLYAIALLAVSVPLIIAIWAILRLAPKVGAQPAPLAEIEFDREDDPVVWREPARGWPFPTVRSPS